MDPALDDGTEIVGGGGGGGLKHLQDSMGNVNMTESRHQAPFNTPLPSLSLSDAVSTKKFNRALVLLLMMMIMLSICSCTSSPLLTPWERK